MRATRRSDNMTREHLPARHNHRLSSVAINSGSAAMQLVAIEATDRRCRA